MCSEMYIEQYLHLLNHMSNKAGHTTPFHTLYCLISPFTFENYHFLSSPQLKDYLS